MIDVGGVGQPVKNASKSHDKVGNVTGWYQYQSVNMSNVLVKWHADHLCHNPGAEVLRKKNKNRSFFFCVFQLICGEWKGLYKCL